MPANASFHAHLTWINARYDPRCLGFSATKAPFTGETEGVWLELSAEPSDIEDLEPIEDDLMPEGGFGIIDVKYADDTRVALDGSLISEW